MKAEVFCLEDQGHHASALMKLLRKHVSPAITTALHNIGSSTDQSTLHDIGWRYVKLLQAAISPNTGLKLSFGELQHFGDRFYIRIYYEMYRERSWNLPPRYFFPAVAIQDRMVIVPQGIQARIFDQGESMSLFKVPGLGGVTEVDFNDEALVSEAVAMTAEELRAETLQEIRAYASYANPEDLRLSKLCKDLNIDSWFIRAALRTEVAKRDFYQQLDCKFDKERMPPDRWTRVTLTIQNNSEVALTDVLVAIRGPAKVLPAHIQTTLPARSTQTLPIAIRPEDKGDFPLEVTVALAEDKSFAELLPELFRPCYVWLHCE